MSPWINSVPGVLAVACSLVALSFYLLKFKLFKSLGPALTCILFAMFLSNVGIMPISHPVYGFMGSHIINLSIAVLLLNVDINSLLKLSKQPLVAMLFACLSVCVLTLAAGMFFVPMIGEEGWKIAGMFVGTYTGGSSNLNAIGVGLEASDAIIAAANAADYVIYTPFIILIMAMGSSLKNIKWFNKFWPFALTDEELLIKGGSDFLKLKEWSIQDIAWLIAVGFIIVGTSTYLSTLIPSGHASTLRILFITTIAIAVAQIKQVKALKGTQDVGLYLSLFYLSKIGFEIDLREFLNSAMAIAIFCLVVMFGSFLIHIILCRFFKIKWQYVLVAMQAAIGSSSSAAALAVASGWESLITIAIVLGVLGNAVGNYLGFGIAYMLKSLLGM